MDKKTLYFVDLYDSDSSRLTDHNKIFPLLSDLYESAGSNIRKQYIMGLTPGSNFDWAISLPSSITSKLIDEGFGSFSNKNGEVHIQQHGLVIPLLRDGFYAINEDFGFDRTSYDWHGIIVNGNYLQEVKLSNDKAYDAYLRCRDNCLFEAATTTGAIAAGVPGLFGHPKKKKLDKIVLGNSDNDQKEGNSESFDDRIDRLLNEYPKR